jgi:HSP20 family protein
MLLRFDYPRTMDTLVEEFFAPAIAPELKSSPAVDVTESEQEFVLVAELPGSKKEDVKITFEHGILTLSGERKPHAVPESAKVVKNELRVRGFERSFEFGQDVDADRISAELVNGLLRVTLPKAPQVKPRTISVK